MARTLIVKPLGLVLQKAGLISSEQIQIALKDRVSLPNCRIGEILAHRGWIEQQTADFFAEQWPKLPESKQQQPIGQYLKAAGLINESQIDTILKEQTSSGLKFGASAVIKGIISQTTLDFFLEQLDLIKAGNWNSNQTPQRLTKAQIERLSQVESYLLYNQRCEPTILFNLYRQIWQQQEIKATGSQAEQELLQSGLVIEFEQKIKLDPCLNKNIFNDSWIENQLVRLQPYSKIRLKLFGLEIKASHPYKVLAEVDVWTNAQPFLTQKIYQIIRDRESFIPRNQEAEKIAELVHKYIIDRWETKIAAPHLLQLRSKFFSIPGDIRSLLLSYREIWHTQSVPFNDTLEHQYLIDIGLIKLEQGKVQIANRIYHNIFDHIWIEEQMAKVNNSISSSTEDNYLNLPPQQVTPDKNQPNSFRMTKIITLTSLIIFGGLAGLGFNLVTKYFQLQKFKQANQLLAQNNHSEAVLAYNELLPTHIAKYEQLWINRGYAFSGLQKYNQMLQSCSSATSINPQAALAWNCQGEALYHLEKYEAALKAFEQATTIDSGETTFWLNKSQALFKLQQYYGASSASEQGIKFLEQLTENKPEYHRHHLAIALNQKGQSLLKKGQYQQAVAAFHQSLANFPTYLSAQQGKGITLYKLGRYNQAAKTFEHILQRNDLAKNQKVISLLYKGISHCDMEQFAAADRAFKQVLQLDTDHQSQKLAQAGCGIR